MNTGYGSKYNRSMDVSELQDFGRQQSLEQDRTKDYSNPNGSWNKPYTDNSLKQGGMGESSVRP